MHSCRGGRSGAALRELRRNFRRPAEQRARLALGSLPERRVQRTPTAHRVGPGQRHAAGPRGFQAAGCHIGGHDSRPRVVRCFPSRWHSRRRARRGNGLRVAPWRNLRTWGINLADRRHLLRTRHRDSGSGAAWQDAVLARRPAWSAAGTRPGTRCLRSRDPRARRQIGPHPADGALPARRVRCEQPGLLYRRASRGHRCGPG